MDIEFLIGESVIITDWSDGYDVYAIGKVEQIIIDKKGVFYSIKDACRGNIKEGRLLKLSEENIDKLKKQGYIEVGVYQIM